MFDSRTDKFHSQNGTTSRNCKCSYCFPRINWVRSTEKVQAIAEFVFDDMITAKPSLPMPKRLAPKVCQGSCYDWEYDCCFECGACSECRDFTDYHYEAMDLVDALVESFPMGCYRTQSKGYPVVVHKVDPNRMAKRSNGESTTWTYYVEEPRSLSVSNVRPGRRFYS